MYYLPEIYVTRDYLVPISGDIISHLQDLPLVTPNTVPCDEDVYNLGVVIMIENNITMPKTVETAVDLYFMLRAEMLNLI